MILKYAMLAAAAACLCACEVPDEYARGQDLTQILPEPELVEQDGEIYRCVNEPVLGSRVGRRMCYTEREWRDIQNAGREYMDDIQGRPIGLPEEG